MTTFLAVSRASSLEIAAVECAGEGVLEKDEDRRFQISRIVLKPRVTILDENDRDRAARLIEKAESFCLIRNSIRSEVTLSPEVLVEAPALVGAGV
jgi:organic hydroperoxide reductase OsmC/OhrA